MYIPVIKKVLYSYSVLIERVLPDEGDLNIELGSEVEPFYELGKAKLSSETIELSPKFKPVVNGSAQKGYTSGEKIGQVGLKAVKAPFPGFLMHEHDVYKYRREERDYTLLSGVWGKVKDVVDKKSVLIETQTVDLHMMACTKGNVEGELIVFPNPSEVLQMQYLQKYSKSVFKKVLYVGDFVDVGMLERAVDSHVSAVIAGSAQRDAFVFAKNHGIFLGVFGGFGELKTPEFMFEILNNVSNRFIFVNGDRHLVRIPMPPGTDPSKFMPKSESGILRELHEGMKVLVLSDLAFGGVGTVEKIMEASIVVKLVDKDEPIEIMQADVLALE